MTDWRLDDAGLALTTGSDAVAGRWNALLDDYAIFRSTVPDRLRELLEADPRLALGWTVRSALLMLSGKAEFLDAARDAARRAVALAGDTTRREQRYAEAAVAWAADDVATARGLWETILIEAPQDLLALKLAQFAHFYAGDNDAMRRSVLQVADAWTDASPRYGRYLGTRAFALEEAGDIDAAERDGRAAVAWGRNDAWAIHAVSHCLETRAAPGEGKAWIDDLEDDWSGAGTMDGHLRWHRALFALEADGPEAVLADFDDGIRVRGSDEYLDLCNDIAMLQRLELRGVDVGGRWLEIADAVERRAAATTLAFCDVHWALCLAAAGRPAAVRALLDRLASAGSTSRSDAHAYRLAAAPTAEGFVAFRSSAWAEALELLLRARPHWGRLGGSHAQRDLFSQVLAAAAAGAGEGALLARLRKERERARPHERDWLPLAA